MLRSSIYTASVVLLGTCAFAQSNIKSQAQAVTAPVKNAGIYHLGTGTWTRASNPIALGSTQSVIYDNTCNTGYFSAQNQNEIWGDEGRLPTTAANGAATTGSAVISGGFDAAPGCQTSYTIEAFQIGYCTSSLAFDCTVGFQESYVTCAVEVPQQAFAISGLPASATAGTQACWIVTLDLVAASATFAMQADGEGSAAVGNDQFGWSFQLTSVPFANNTDGPILAGGINVGTSFATCTGTDGTRWDTNASSPAPLYPANQPPFLGGAADEPGTGMGNVDAMRIDNNPALAAGCYFFGGNPRASLHLELWSTANCAPASPLTQLCTPGQGGVNNCPCGAVANPVNPNTGCQNYTGTGGGQISCAGTPTAATASDTLVFTGTSVAPTSGILLQGTTQIAAGVAFGNGVRCVGGSLKRLYVKANAGGTFTAPVGADPTVWDRSNALGDTIPAASTRFYMIYYREQNNGSSVGTCTSGAGQFNATNSGSILWQ